MTSTPNTGLGSYPSKEDLYNWMQDYVQIFIDILGDDITDLQMEGIQALMAIILKYQEQLNTSLIRIIFEKKLLMLFTVNTKSEMAQLLKPCEIRYNGNGFSPKNRFHLYEEEALMWMETSLRAPLNSAGFERYIEVFGKLFPDQVHLITH